MNRMDRLIKSIREAVSDSWGEFRSRFGIDDDGMIVIATKTSYGTVEDMTAVTPKEVYDNDPSSFLVGVREANPELQSTPDEDIISAVTGQETSFSAESLWGRNEDDDPFGEWGPLLFKLTIDQPTFDSIACEVGYKNSSDLVANNPSPIDLTDEMRSALLDAIMALVPSAQGLTPEQVNSMIAGDFTGGGEGGE